MLFRRLAVVSVLLPLAGCAKESPVDPTTVPASIVAVTAATQNGTVGLAVGTTPTFEVRNASGDALGSVPVTVAVTSGGGSLTGSPTTTLEGATPIGSWTLGTVAGAQTVTVTRGSLTPLVFTATAAPGAATGVAITGGNNQSALAGAAVATAVQGSVVDQFGNPRAGETVSWSITAGGGSLTGATTTVANGAGLANAPAWTLGKNGGTQTLRASSGAFQAFAAASIQSAYQLDLRWIGTPPTGATLLAFTRAVDRIKATIVGSVGPIGIVGFTNISQCATPGMSAPFSETSITGVIIYATIYTDAPGGVLGSAGPCLIRDGAAQFKTALGTMRFDSADLPTLVADGRIDAVILHEMLHVIGIGTLWDPTSNNLLSGAGTADSRYIGAQARAACASQNGGTTTCATTVPVHSTDGPGSADSHWREATFTTELMTPFIAAGQTPIVSAMTIAALTDIGYTVNLSTKDDFQLGSGLAAVFDGGGGGSSNGQSLLLGTPLKPTFMVERSGRLKRLRDAK